MWIFRELFRLLLQIAVAVAIASAVAAIKAAASGGSMLHTWKITLFVMAGLMLLLAAGGSGPANRRLNQRFDHGPTFVFRNPALAVKPGQPTLTASAVFVGSGLALLALALAV